jgi:hypothetical protein
MFEMVLWLELLHPSLGDVIRNKLIGYVVAHHELSEPEVPVDLLLVLDIIFVTL